MVNLNDCNFLIKWSIWIDKIKNQNLIIVASKQWNSLANTETTLDLKNEKCILGKHDWKIMQK